MLNNSHLQFIKFLFVGAINTLFGYFVFALMIFLKLHYTLAALISIVSSIIFNFKTTGSIVFNNSNNKLLPKFIFVYFISYIFSITFLKLFLLAGLENMYLNSMILIIPNAILTFTLMKKYVFKK